MDFASCFDVSVENDGTNAFRLTLDVDEGRLIEEINNTFTPTDIFDSRYITECAFEIMEEDGIVNFFKNYQGDNRELMKRFLKEWIPIEMVKEYLMNCSIAKPDKEDSLMYLQDIKKYLTETEQGVLKLLEEKITHGRIKENVLP